MKIIDLLNKIANDEEVPKKIKFRNHIFEYEDYDYFASDYGYLFDTHNVSGMLNDEVEIIEENKIPEKLNFNHKAFEDDVVKLEYKNQTLNIGNVLLKMSDRIDKIIDYLDYLKSKGE